MLQNGHILCTELEHVVVAGVKSIDTDNFICLVKIYTNIEQSYNETCDIISFCILENEPSGVVCDNGIPTLTY